MATKLQRVRREISLFSGKKKFIRVTLKIKEIQTKLMMNSHYQIEKQ